MVVLDMNIYLFDISFLSQRAPDRVVVAFMTSVQVNMVYESP